MALPFKDASIVREKKSKLYTEQEVREFHTKMYESKDGCYSFHAPTWSKMCKEHPVLVCELEIERSRKIIDENFNIQKISERPSGTRKVKDGLHNTSFPWYELGCGFAIGSLFWGIMFTLFGGN